MPQWLSSIGCSVYFKTGNGTYMYLLFRSYVFHDTKLSDRIIFGRDEGAKWSCAVYFVTYIQHLRTGHCYRPKHTRKKCRWKNFTLHVLSHYMKFMKTHHMQIPFMTFSNSIINDIQILARTAIIYIYIYINKETWLAVQLTSKYQWNAHLSVVDNR